MSGGTIQQATAEVRLHRKSRTACLEGVVLRYGQFYGPGTWNTAQNGPLAVHIDAAAHAALLAVEAKHTGIFNIAEENGLVSIERARCELGWSPAFRLKSKV